MVSIRSDLQRKVLSALQEGCGEPDPDQAAFVAVGCLISALQEDPPSRARFLDRWEEPDRSGVLDLTPATIAVARSLASQFEARDARRFADLCARALELSFDAETTSLNHGESTEVAHAIALTLAEHHGEATAGAVVVGYLLDQLRQSEALRDRIDRLARSDRAMLKKSLEHTRWATARVADWRRVGLANLSRGWESGSVGVDEPVWVRVVDVEQKWRNAVSAAFSVELEPVGYDAPQRAEPPFEPPPTTRYHGNVWQERSVEERLLSSVRSTLRALARHRVDLAKGGLDVLALDLLRFVIADPNTPTSAELAEKLTEHPAVFDVRCSHNDLAAHLDSVIDVARSSR